MATATATNDELSTSPIKERKNSLEQALSKRPEPKELEDRNILHSGPPVIVQRQQELEKAMTHDSLKKHLAARPVKEDLVQRNILPENTHVAPALAAHQKELEKAMLEDSLKGKLAKRPPPSKVIDQGILNPDEDPTNPSN